MSSVLRKKISLMHFHWSFKLDGFILFQEQYLSLPVETGAAAYQQMCSWLWSLMLCCNFCLLFQHWFTGLPVVLKFMLSRFLFNQSTGRAEKIHERFLFDRVIFMDRYGITLVSWQTWKNIFSIILTLKVVVPVPSIWYHFFELFIHIPFLIFLCFKHPFLRTVNYYLFDVFCLEKTIIIRFPSICM